MSDHGQQHRPPTTSDPGTRAEPNHFKANPRDVGARMFMRKAADGQSEADGAEVSQPGDSAEKEADAVADHVADGLHGEKHGAEPGEAPKQAAPPIAAKLRPGTLSMQKKGDKPGDKRKARTTEVGFRCKATTSSRSCHGR
jgi:hypothetical protein